MKARYYIYRNLRTKTFSVKYKGKIIAHPTNFVCYNVTFKVSEVGRKRVINFKRKNVHAYVVCDNWCEVNDIEYDIAYGISYNPYVNENFMLGRKPIKNCDTVFGINGNKIYKGKE